MFILPILRISKYVFKNFIIQMHFKKFYNIIHIVNICVLWPLWWIMIINVLILELAVIFFQFISDSTKWLFFDIYPILFHLCQFQHNFLSSLWYVDNLLCIESEIAELYYREKEKARGIIRKNVQYDMQILTGLQTYIDMVLWHSLYRPTEIFS